MNWVPTDDFVHPHSVWLCSSYYKPTTPAQWALLGPNNEAPMKNYLILILVHPETGRWVRSKTKHGDLEKLRESEAADNLDFLSSAAFRELDFTDNLGHDDEGRMMFYDNRLIPKKEEQS